VPRLQARPEWTAAAFKRALGTCGSPVQSRLAADKPSVYEKAT
jgi:hypothetical protein